MAQKKKAEAEEQADAEKQVLEAAALKEKEEAAVAQAA